MGAALRRRLRRRRRPRRFLFTPLFSFLRQQQGGGGATTTTTTTAAAAAGSSAATTIAGGFLEGLSHLPQDQKEEALIATRNGLSRTDRALLRKTAGVSAPDEMTPAAVSAKVNEELKALTKFMAADARANGQDGVAGAKRFVTDGAVLPDVDWEKDVEKKRDAAPVFMASLGAALQAESSGPPDSHGRLDGGARK